MRSSHDTSLLLYGVGIEHFDHHLYEIVLPGRTHLHARKAAEILLATSGTAQFKPFDLMGSGPTDLASEYRAGLPNLLPALLKAYGVLSNARTELRAEPELFEALEYQIDAARRVIKPAPEQLRTFLQQRALCRLPVQIKRAEDLSRTPANGFEPHTRLARSSVSAARAFAQSLEKDAREIAALKTRIHEEHRFARAQISRAAHHRFATIRVQINAAFAPQYQALKAPAQSLVATFDQSMIPIGALAREALRKATVQAHQQALKSALQPVIDEKRAALLQANQLHDRFHNTDRALSQTSTPGLQRLWRALSSEHARQTHGPASITQPHATKPGFIERLASRADLHRDQRPASEQNNHPELD
ncbi:MAG: hypothetical protein K2X41_05435 [Hyphomicrobium sp.]|nr:hypothetical protein [Hyphomicrobium sp.]